MQSAATLTPLDIEHFQRDGYVLVRDFYDQELMQTIRAWTEEVQSYPEVPGKYMMYFEQSLLGRDQRILSRLEDFLPFHSGFDQLVRNAKMSHAVSELFGGPAALFKDKINFKMPSADGFTPHQDVQAGWEDYARYYITALIVSANPNRITVLKCEGAIFKMLAQQTTGNYLRNY